VPVAHTPLAARGAALRLTFVGGRDTLRIVRRSILVGTLVVASACAPFGSGGAAPSDGGSVGDGSPGTPDGGALEDDAAADGSPARSPCTGVHALCEDFDGPTPWEAWVYRPSPQSPIVADSARFVSAPASLRVVVEPTSSGDDHPSFLTRPLAPNQRLMLKADIAVSLSAGRAPDGEIDVLALELEAVGFDRYFVAIVAHSGGSFILQTKCQPSGGEAVDERKALGNLGAEFKTVRLDVNLDEGRVIASLDAMPPVVASTNRAVGTGAQLAVGAAWANNTVGSFGVNVDNVIVDH